FLRGGDFVDLRRFDSPGGNGIDPDLKGAKLDGPELRQFLQSGFCGAIGLHLGRGIERKNGRYVYDDASAVIFHDARGGLRSDVGREDVQAKELFECSMACVEKSKPSALDVAAAAG